MRRPSSFRPSAAPSCAPSGVPSFPGRSNGLHIIALIAQAEISAALRQAVALDGDRDRLTECCTLEDGLTHAGLDLPDLVLVQLGFGDLPEGELVGRFQSVARDASVYVLAALLDSHPNSTRVQEQGDGILPVAAGVNELQKLIRRVRDQRMEQARRVALERQCASILRGAELLAGVAELSKAKSRRDAAERLADLFRRQLGAERVLVYLPSGEGSRQLVRLASLDDDDEIPYLADEMRIMTQASLAGLDVLRLALRQEGQGVVLLGGVPWFDGEERIPLASVVAVQAATVFELIGAREQSHHGGMKDPNSSAYTFGYFVDVAGREIGRARRHGRAFSLVTLGVEGAGREDELEACTGQVIECVLSTVRATDVLARVDIGELYLLLPETGGIGAHVVRRRLQAAFRSNLIHLGMQPASVAVGIATYPHCGGDLSQLLRLAKQRAEAARRSVVRRLALESLAIPEILDALLWDHADTGRGGPTLEAPYVIEVPAIDALQLAACALTEARRAGPVRVTVTDRPGVSIGTVLRAALGRDPCDVQLRAVDVSGTPYGRDLEVMTLVSEQGCYSLIGRVERGYVRAVHSVDPALVDLLTIRLGELVGTRLNE